MFVFAIQFVELKVNLLHFREKKSHVGYVISTFSRSFWGYSNEMCSSLSVWASCFIYNNDSALYMGVYIPLCIIIKQNKFLVDQL